MNLLDILPPELLKSIHKYLNTHDRIIARSACKSWFNEFTTNHFNIHLLLPQQIPQIVEHFKNKKIRLTVHKSDKCNEAQLHELLNGLNDTTSIELKWLYPTQMIKSWSLKDFQNLQSLILPNFSILIREQIPHLTYLDIKDLTANSFKALLPKLEVYKGPMTTQALSIINPDTLTRFTVKNIGNEYTTDVSFNRFSCLKRLNASSIEDVYAVYYGPFGGSEPRHPLQLELPFLEKLSVSMAFTCTSTRLTKLTTNIPVNTHGHTQLKSLKASPHAFNPAIVRDMPLLEELDICDSHCVLHEQFLNVDRLTKLLITASQTIQKSVGKLTNLRTLCLTANHEYDQNLFNLSKLESLTLLRASAIDDNWIGSLTKLTHLEINLNKNVRGVLSVQDLTNLRRLIVPISFSKEITGIEFLTNLEVLEAPHVNDEVLSDLLKLTRLICCQVDTCHRVSFLTRLRELDCCFNANEDIVALTALRHLTYLICRTRTCDPTHMTLLTGLQSVAVSSNVSERSDWSVKPWSRYNARFEITSKLPHLILSPGK